MVYKHRVYRSTTIFSSARWQSAAQVYQNRQSPVPGQQYGFPDPVNDRENMCLTPHKLSQQLLLQAGINGIGYLFINNFFIYEQFRCCSSPLSLEDIAAMNRKRHQDQGHSKLSIGEGGPLELEAIAAVHELSSCVRTIAVSEILPRTADLIFVNVKTLEGVITFYYPIGVIF